MPKKNKNKRTDEEREHQRCSGCDCYETEDGCECKIVACSQCGYNDNLFNMNHDEFHTFYWFNEMEYYTKMCEVKCDKCYNEPSDY